MKKMILLFEDTKEHAILIHSSLKDYEISHVTSLKEGKEFLATHAFDLILLDLKLSDGIGLELFSDKTLIKNIPILICSDKDDITSKVAGFSMGAIDYLTKPFNPIELKIRVDSILNRISKDNHRKTISINGLDLDLEKNSAEIIEGEQIINLGLTSLEFKILKYLILNKEKVVTRNQVIDEVWGVSSYVTDRSIDAHISKIRKKLGSKNEMIRSIYGLGYIFEHTNKKAA